MVCNYIGVYFGKRTLTLIEQPGLKSIRAGYTTLTTHSVQHANTVTIISSSLFFIDKSYSLLSENMPIHKTKALIMMNPQRMCTMEEPRGLCPVGPCHTSYISIYMVSDMDSCSDLVHYLWCAYFQV